METALHYQKLSGPVRRALRRSRETVLDTPRKEKMDGVTKLLRKLGYLSMAKLIRRLKQSKNHIRRAESLADKLAEDSVFRPEMEKQIHSWKTLNRLTTEEICYRRQSPLARPHDGHPNNDNNITGPTC